MEGVPKVEEGIAQQQQQQLMEVGQNPGAGQQQLMEVGQNLDGAVQQQQPPVNNNGQQPGQPTEGAVTTDQPTTEVKQEGIAGEGGEVEPEDR